MFLLSLWMLSASQVDGGTQDVSYLKKPSLLNRSFELALDPIGMIDAGAVRPRLGGLSKYVEDRGLFQPLILPASNQRARSVHIGSVMAVLATFDEAHVLPPEHDPQANQLIHTLIQVQSAVMKSHNAEFRAWVSDASKQKFNDVADSVLENVQDTGLTMDFLEALVDYSDIHPPWARAAVTEGFQAFNVQREDWVLLRKILLDARTQLALKGESLSEVFAKRRLDMPGAAR